MTWDRGVGGRLTESNQEIMLLRPVAALERAVWPIFYSFGPGIGELGGRLTGPNR